MRALQDAFLAPLAALDFTAGAAQHYADIRHHPRRLGTPIGERDQLLAAGDRANVLTLVIHNRRGFDRLPELASLDRT